MTMLMHHCEGLNKERLLEVIADQEKEVRELCNDNTYWRRMYKDSIVDFERLEESYSNLESELVSSEIEIREFKEMVDEV